MNNTVPPREKFVSLGASPVTVDVTAQWFACTQSSEPFLVSLNGQPEFSFSSGMFLALPGVEIESVRISRAPAWSVSTNAITILSGVGNFVDNRLTVSSGLSIAAGQVIGQSAAAVLSGGVADVVLVANTNTLLFSLNASARCRRVRNTSAVSSVRLATAPGDLTAGRGEFLDIGDVGEFFVRGEIYARSTGTPTLICTEEIF